MTQSRRSILKGLSLGTGGLLLTPFLRQVELHAEGTVKNLPSRFFFFVKDEAASSLLLRPESVSG
jgi:hypothetical protein